MRWRWLLWPRWGGDPRDVCRCGDYRREHRALGCRVCRAHHAPWDKCRGFRLWIAERDTEDWRTTPG